MENTIKNLKHVLILLSFLNCSKNLASKKVGFFGFESIMKKYANDINYDIAYSFCRSEQSKFNKTLDLSNSLADSYSTKFINFIESRLNEYPGLFALVIFEFILKLKHELRVMEKVNAKKNIIKKLDEITDFIEVNDTKYLINSFPCTNGNSVIFSFDVKGGDRYFVRRVVSCNNEIFFFKTDDGYIKSERYDNVHFKSIKKFPLSIKKGILQKCSICLSSLKNIKTNELFLTSCDHLFHKECLQNWITSPMENDMLRSIKNTCPLCRRILNTMDVHDIQKPKQGWDEAFVSCLIL